MSAKGRRPNRKFRKRWARGGADPGPPETVLPEEVLLEGEERLGADPVFDLELDYEGYRTIEGYDNDLLSGDVDAFADHGKPLQFKGRMEKPESEEEDAWDRQEGRKPIV
ncbi:MAG: hypothetical protein EBX52_06480 [Proteobacteria bacterium]|nr:hypothetical protein [Pseudomonadota bacterium]